MIFFKNIKRILVFLLAAAILAGALSACGKKEEETTVPETVEVTTTVPETTEEETEEPVPSVTAMGITCPQNLATIGIDIYDCVFFEGPLVTQDGTWEWYDANETTPQRGDLIVYYNNEDYVATHEAICVLGYNDGVYMNIDGNYGEEPGGLWKGRYDSGTPNKSWPDSYPTYSGTEIAKGIWRSINPANAELMALAAEAVYEEYQKIGQTNFLNKYIPELYYGVWCYYLIPIAVNAVAMKKVQLPDDFQAPEPSSSNVKHNPAGSGKLPDESETNDGTASDNAETTEANPGDTTEDTNN